MPKRPLVILMVSQPTLESIAFAAINFYLNAYLYTLKNNLLKNANQAFRKVVNNKLKTINYKLILCLVLNCGAMRNAKK